MKKRIIIIISIFIVVFIFIALNRDKSKEETFQEEANIKENEEQLKQDQQIENVEKSPFTIPYKDENNIPGLVIDSITDGKYKEFEVKGTYPYQENGISIILKHKEATIENKIGYYFETKYGKITFDYSLNEEGIDDTNVYLQTNSFSPMSPQYGVLWKTDTPLSVKEFEIKVDVKNISLDKYLYTFFIKIVEDNEGFKIESIRNAEDLSQNEKIIENSISFLQETNLKSILNTDEAIVNKLNGIGSLKYRTKDDVIKLLEYDSGIYQVHIGTKNDSGIKEVYVILNNDFEIIGYDYKLK